MKYSLTLGMLKCSTTPAGGREGEGGGREVNQGFLTRGTDSLVA